MNTINTMLEYCRKTVVAYDTYMADASAKYSDDDELFLTEPEKNYSSFVGDNLERIDDEEDIVENVEIVQQMIKKDVLYYLITGKPSN